MPCDSPLSGGYSRGSVEGSMKLNELTDLCTKLVDRVTTLENELTQTKQVYSHAITKLVKKVKRLEDKLKSTNKKKKAKMVISDEEEDLVSENSSKQGRMKDKEHEEVETKDAEVEYDLDQQVDQTDQVTPTKATHAEEQSHGSSDTQFSVLSASKILAEVFREKVKTYIRRRRSTDSFRVSTAGSLFSTAEEILCTDERIAQKLDEEEKAKAAARKKQEKIDFEKALKLQKQFDQERKEADDIDSNKIVEQVQERQSGSMIRYQALKKKPVTIAQATKNMKIYLKNMAGYKMTNFKGMRYEQIRPIFEKEYNKVQTLFQKNPEVGNTEKKRIAEEALLQESFKKLRTAQASSSEPIQEQSTTKPKELSEEDLKKMMEIVLVEEFKAEVLQTKYPIIDWEIHTEDSRKYWKIIRVNDITEAYQSFEDMLKSFDREDLDTLWRLVKERFT
ncbi:hypothetical protein Tco_1139021 [Tanacetum coccineum]